VTVYNDPISGWTATVFAPPADVTKIVQIVYELHAKYDLKEEPEAPRIVDADLATALQPEMPTGQIERQPTGCVAAAWFITQPSMATYAR